MWCVVKCLLRFSVQIKSSFICLNVSFWLAKHLTLLSSICVVTACPNLHLPGNNGQKLFFLGKKNPLFLAEKKLSWFLGQFLVKHTVVVVKSLVAKKQSVLYLFLCLPKKTMALLLLLPIRMQGASPLPPALHNSKNDNIMIFGKCYGILLKIVWMYLIQS